MQQKYSTDQRFCWWVWGKHSHCLHQHLGMLRTNQIGASFNDNTEEKLRRPVVEKSSSASVRLSNMDIGKYVQNRLALPDATKRDRLIEPWQPSTRCRFPRCSCVYSSKKCCFESIVYREVEAGCSMLVLVFISTRSSKRLHGTLGTLVTLVLSGAQKHCVKAFKDASLKDLSPRSHQKRIVVSWFLQRRKCCQKINQAVPERPT